MKEALRNSKGDVKREGALRNMSVECKMTNTFYFQNTVREV
jgi:hypothetical protein